MILSVAVWSLDINELQQDGHKDSFKYFGKEDDKR